MERGMRRATTTRLGLTVPLPGISLAEHAGIVAALPGWGYTEVWSGESSGFDAFTPLALAAAWAPELSLGTAVVPVFTRGPAVIAQSAAALASAAPGRVQLGIGSSSPAVVQAWNGIEFEKPYQRTRDVLRFLRGVLAGEKVTRAYSTFSVNGFRLETPPAQPVPLLLAALRPQMLALAGREADGVILNWLGSGDVRKCVAQVGRPETLVVARILVAPTEDVEAARDIGRRLIAGYLTVPGYAAFQEWLGRGPEFSDMWSLWAEGKRAAAVRSIADETVDSLILHGDAGSVCRAVEEYVEAGVDVPVLALLQTPDRSGAGALADVVARLGKTLTAAPVSPAPRADGWLQPAAEDKRWTWTGRVRLRFPACLISGRRRFLTRSP
jgi:probable F420-dependent oxidoreductase